MANGNWVILLRWKSNNNNNNNNKKKKKKKKKKYWKLPPSEWNIYLIYFFPYVGPGIMYKF